MSLIERMAAMTDIIRDADVLRAGDIVSMDIAQQQIWIVREYGGRGRTKFAIATYTQVADRPADDRLHAGELRRTQQAMMLIDRMIISASLPPAEISVSAQAALKEFTENYGEMRQILYADAGTGAYKISFESFFRRSFCCARDAEKAAAVIGEEMIRRSTNSLKQAQVDLAQGLLFRQRRS